MGRIINIASHLDGVGKTVTTLNLGMCLAGMGHSVLLVDGDPQGGLSLASGLGRRTDFGLFQFLAGKADLEKIVHKRERDGLSLVRLGVVEPQDLFGLEKRAQKGEIGDAIGTLARKYAYVLIDTPGGCGLLTTVLLGCSDSVIMPLPCRTLAVKSMPLFLQLLLRVRQILNPELQFAGAIFSMVDSLNPYEMDIMTDLRQGFPAATFFSTMIPFDRSFEKAAAHGIPIGMLKEYEDIARGYTSLANELIIRDQKLQKQGDDTNEQPDSLI